ncbi:MAG: tetratricopeptide repeat protein [Myxococcales bacterium]
MRVRVALLVCLIGGSAALANPREEQALPATGAGQRPEHPEDDAARTFAALHEKPGADPRQQVAQMLGALDAAGLHNLGTVALGDLLQEGAAEVRAAAAQELSKRAANGGVGLALLLRAPAAGLPSATAVKLARAHLERALVVAPPEEGSSFAPMQGRAAEPTPVAATEAAPAPETVSAAQKLASSELALSRILAASVPAGDAAEGDARETEALAALAAGDVDAAQAAFEAVVKVSVKGDESSARHERAVLQLARLAYARGDDARAQAWYSKISRAAPEWLDALFESSWSHFRNGDDDKALGNLLTLHAPFFQGRYYPESYVLKALVLYENCRYPEARRTLREFEVRYRPLHDGLAGALERMPTAQAAVDSLSGAGGLAAFPEAARDEVARVISAPELKTGFAQIAQIAQELDSIDRRPSFQRTALARAALPKLREARLDLLQSVGDRVRSRLSLERGELRELLGQGLRLDFEIAGREKEIAETPDGAVAPVAQHRTPPTVDEDEVLWPFEGEYWRDELGSYRYQLGEKCAKPRPAPAKPVRTAATSVASDAVATPGPAALH